jgi:excisionase family DNA binding protein
MIDAYLARIVDELTAARAEIRGLAGEVAALRAASPSRLVTVAEMVRLGYGSPATIRRRIAEGSIPAIRHGRSVRVDLAALKPIDPTTVAGLAMEARR